MNLNEIITKWQFEKKHFVKRSTMSAYSLLIQNHIVPFFGECDNITEDLVQEFVLTKLNEGLSQKTVKDILITLKMIMKYGAKKDLIIFKPWDVNFPTDHTQYKVEIFTKDEHKKAIAYTKEHFTFRNLGILICLSTGMRIGEICALKWSDIDIDSQVINVNRTIQRIYVIENGTRRTELIIDNPKTKNSNREIPLTKDLLNIIKPIKKLVNEDFYVITNDEKPTEPRTYRSYYKNLMEKMNLPVINFHGLRHSFATRCIEGKADVKTVSVLLGHSNISTTMNLYVHPNTEQKKSVINNVFKNM